MSETDEDPIGDENAAAIDAATFEQGVHAMTPDEAGMSSMAEVIAQSQDTHERVAVDMEGVDGFPEPEQD